MVRTANTAHFWDRVARKYSASTISDPAGYEKTLERTLRHLGRGDTILEFGCGTGTTALRLAPHVAHITATDISGEMIEIAREKADASAHHNVEFRCSTLEDDPALDVSFDAVLAFNALHLMTDRMPVLTRAYRLLKPGGLFISKTPSLSEMHPAFRVAMRIALPVMQWIGKAPYVAFFSAAELEAEIVAAGFAIIERGSHASKGRDYRPFFVARKP